MPVQKLRWFMFLLMAGIFLLLLAHPWWLAGVGRYVLQKQGIEVGSVKVEGFKFFHLSQIRFQPDAERAVTLNELSIRQPLSWLWNLRQGSTDPWLQAKDLMLIWTSGSDSATTQGDTARIPADIMRFWQTTTRWLPLAQVESVRITWLDPEISGFVERVLWDDGALRVEGFRLEDIVFGDLSLRSTAGSARVLLRRGEFEVAVHAESVLQTPQLQETAELAFAGSFNTDTFTVDVLNLQWPGMDAHLDRPLRGSLQDWEFEAPASFHLVTDLSQWTAGWARGEVAAALLWQGWVDDALDAAIAFTMDAQGVQLPWLQIDVAQFQAVLDAKHLQVDAAKLVLREGSEVTFNGILNYRSRILENSALTLRWQGMDFAYWLPEWATKSSGELSANAEGSLHAVNHAISLETGWVTLPNNEAVKIRMNTQGRHDSISEGIFILHHSDLELGMEFSLDRTGQAFRLVSPKYRIQHRQLPELFSTDTLRLTFTPGAPRPDLAMQGLALRDPDGETQLAINLFLEQLRLRAATVQVRQLNSRDLRAFIGADIPELAIRELAVQLQSRPGLETAPVTGTLKLSGYHPMTEDTRLQVTMNADLAADGLRVTEGRALVDGESFLQLEGLIPLTIVRSGEQYRHHLDFRSRMRASARFTAHPLLLDWLNAVADLDIQGPEGEIDLTGTLRAPNGRISVSAAHIGTPFAIGGETIVVDQPVLHAELTPSVLRLLQASGIVRHEPFALTAQMPMRSADWEALFSAGTLPDWRGGTLELFIQEMRLETLAAIYPDLLGRTGTLSANATFTHREGMSGLVEIRNLQTRPLPNGAVLDRMNARLQLSGETAEIRDFSAFISGQPLELSGSLSFPDWQSVAYDLQLRGQQLPFWRQDQILLRGDLDLRFSKLEGESAPLLSGEIGFRDSIFIQEVNLFAGGTRAGGRIRPPFFSVEEAPFSDWRLSLHLRGRDFLRVQSPFLLGRVSADFRLRGTLGDPLLFGSAFMEQGSILFNFGTLQLQRAQARIPLENPFLIELDVMAQGRSFGYDITLQLEGTEQDPRVQFSSNPALGQREILQLLVAGVMPEQAGGGAQSGQRYALLLGRNVWQQLFPGTGGSFAERLEIRNGRDISERGRDTYELEFRLNNRMTLHGEYDRFDDFNFGIRWHLFTR